MGRIGSEHGDERRKFTNRVLCPEVARSWVGEGDVEERVEGVVMSAKAPTTATRKRKKFKVQDGLREMAVVAGCWDLVKEGSRGGIWVRGFGALSMGKMLQ